MEIFFHQKNLSPQLLPFGLTSLHSGVHSRLVSSDHRK